MNVTHGDLETLARRKAQQAAQRALSAAIPAREGWQDGALTVFVPGRPRNPLNGSHEHWSKRAKWAKGWRERTHSSVAVYWLVPRWHPSRPKRITFTIYGPSRFDDDNVRAVCKPVRDALKDMAVIDDDRPSAGHTFEYCQAKPTRKAGATHGIAVRIELASARRAAAAPVDGGG